MAGPGKPQHVVQFGAFQADLNSGELFKNGLKVRLPEQPFRMLAVLLECPGEVVSRDELRRRYGRNSLTSISIEVSTRQPASCERHWAIRPAAPVISRRFLNGDIDSSLR